MNVVSKSELFVGRFHCLSHSSWGLGVMGHVDFEIWLTMLPWSFV